MILRQICKLTVIIVLCSCSKKMEIADIAGPQPNTVAYVKSLHRGSTVTVNEEQTISARVVGNDMYGNIYDAIYLQDNSSGIEVAIQGPNLYFNYNLFSKVEIFCQGLTLHTFGRQMVLCYGVEQGQVIPIPQSEVHQYISVVADAPLEEIVPRTTTIDNLTYDDIGSYVLFEEVHFDNYTEGMLWSDGTSDYTTHYLVDAKGQKIGVPISKYARFASYTLPAGRGSVAGIITWFNGDYQLTVCDHSLVRLDN